MSSMEGYKEDLKQAMKTSSMKGLPRIFSAPNWFHKILWIVAFIGLLGICLLTVTSNIITFLEYPQVMNVEEKLMSHIDPNGTVPFPAIAVCNRNQIGSNESVFEENGIPLPGEYYDKVYEMTKCDDCTAEVKLFADFLKRKLMSKRGYYQYVGKGAMAKIGEQHFVLMCQALVSSGTSVMAFPCQYYSTVSRFIHPDIGVCTAYEAQLSEERMIIGYTFTLHLDSSVDNLNTEFEPLLSPQPNSGVTVYAMDPNIAPNTYIASTTASPGKATEVSIKIIRTDRLSTPYSRECIDADKKEKHLFQGQQYNYDYGTCLGRCNLDFVEQKCNCTDLFMLLGPEDGPPMYKYCGSVNQPAYNFFINMYCSEFTKGPAYLECIEKCKEPCKEIKYVLRTATTKWPLPSQIASFYTNVIQKDPILYEKYSRYEDIAIGMASKSENVTELDRLLISKAIEDNFALVSIELGDLYYTHYESKEKIPVNAFISQLGGSLNLWSGITVVLVVEIIDLVFRILGRMTKTKKKIPVQQVRPAPDTMVAEGKGTAFTTHYKINTFKI